MGCASVECSEKAHIIVEMEQAWPRWHKYHAYLHYVENVDKYKQKHVKDWQGVANRVHQLLDAQNQELCEMNQVHNEALREEVCRKIEDHEKKIDDKLAAVHREMQDLSAQLGDLLSRL